MQGSAKRGNGGAVRAANGVVQLLDRFKSPVEWCGSSKHVTFPELDIDVRGVEDLDRLRVRADDTRRDLDEPSRGLVVGEPPRFNDPIRDDRVDFDEAGGVSRDDGPAGAHEVVGTADNRLLGGGLKQGNLCVGSMFEDQPFSLRESINPICFHIVHSQNPAARALFDYVKLETVLDSWCAVGSWEPNRQHHYAAGALSLVSAVALDPKWLRGQDVGFR
ncbi:unnamed protein product [Tilletia controversa]|nr:unnamed protein product [Tilletia controversa]